MILVTTLKLQEVICQRQGALIWGGPTQIEEEEAHCLTMITQDMAPLTVLPCFHHQEDADIWRFKAFVETKNIVKEFEAMKNYIAKLVKNILVTLQMTDDLVCVETDQR